MELAIEVEAGKEASDGKVTQTTLTTVTGDGS